MTGEDIERYLASDGWPCQRLDEETWLSGFENDGHDPFRLFVRVTQDWLCLTIIPFVIAPADPHAALPLYRRLLELNHELTLAKFAIDQREVILTVELPIEHLVPSQLKDGLDAMMFYANAHHTELTSLTLLS